MSETPSWYPQEVALAGRENLDSDHVRRYDGKMDADAAAEVTKLRSLGMDGDSVVLEFGPGTGQFTVAAAQVARRVIAADVSPPMLAALARTLADQRLRNVELVDAGFLSYRHSSPAVDVIYTRYALHHLPDFWKAMALQRLRRMLRTGGVLRLWDVVYDFAPADAATRIEAWCALGGESVEGEWSRAEMEEHVRDEHSTFAWLLEPMIAHNGFAIEEVERDVDTFDAKYMLRAV